MSGVLLMLQDSAVANRDCDQCTLYVFNETEAKPEIRNGKPVARPKGTATPCFYNRCVKGKPNAYTALLPHNWYAYEHYKECEATGSFPDDPIVRRNARLIKMVEDEIAKHERKAEAMLSQIRQIQ